MFEKKATGSFGEAQLVEELREISASEDAWFDGTIGSIDNRLSRLTKLETRLRSVVAVKNSSGLLQDLIMIGAQVDQLKDLRQSFFQPTYDLPQQFYR